ncbi:MAG: biotin transporter BioY [Oscillospiraceae bacterium]|nr:biotin transporter BioY [Oscillospiraceae bacterium]
MKDPVSAEKAGRKRKIYTLTVTAVMTAVTCILAPISISIGTIPISFTNLAIYLSLFLLGWKIGTVSVVVYLLIGLTGIPVFSGFTGGVAKLVGPTGGYLIGFIPMAVVAGLVIEKTNNRFLQFAGMVAGTAIAYALGTAWYCVVMNSGVVAALSVCVFPFIPVDIAKIVIAIVVGSMLKTRLRISRPF